MSALWGLCLLACAFYWTALACGLIVYSPWVVTFAFAFVAFSCLISALKAIVGAQ